jgi:cellulose synthase/poly-beta-1,6-N-acetylglucosamine synthase-like glycosyltransferase
MVSSVSRLAGVAEVLLIFAFLAFYAGLLYNVPVLAAGVRDLRRSRRCGSKKDGEKEVVLPSFSIVLPVKNEEKVVGRTLDSLSRLRYPADRFEVVIVDDGSVDATEEVCRRFVATHGNFRFLRRVVSGGKASAVNYGCRRSSGEVVAVFDADNVPSGDVLSVAADYLADSGVAAVQGRIYSINSHENMLTQFMAYEDAVWCEAVLRGKEALGLFVPLRGCCQFIRRSVLESMGGFDEDCLVEDMEISARLIENGKRIKYAPDVHVWQENPSNLKGFLRQRIRWCRGYMEVAFKYGRLLKRLDRRTLDAELTLFLPFMAIASFLLYTITSWGVLTALPFGAVLDTLMVFSAVTTYILVFLAGIALIYHSKPKRLKNLLWLPFVFGYWSLQSFVALYAGLLILFRRPRHWTKTERSGTIANPEFTIESLKSDVLQ